MQCWWEEAWWIGCAYPLTWFLILFCGTKQTGLGSWKTCHSPINPCLSTWHLLQIFHQFHWIPLSRKLSFSSSFTELTPMIWGRDRDQVPCFLHIYAFCVLGAESPIIICFWVASFHAISRTGYLEFLRSSGCVLLDWWSFFWWGKVLGARRTRGFFGDVFYFLSYGAYGRSITIASLGINPSRRT